MPREVTERFSDRVADYIRYRPDYPAQVITFLKEKAGLSEHSVVTDIGSGTGIFTRHLLSLGCKVNAVEPNEPMREAAEGLLASYNGFVSVAGTATATTLPDRSADLITCAQAFHWFNSADTKEEFRRILKPEGSVALIWNNRITDADAFAGAYDNLLQKQSLDYNAVNHQNLGPDDFARLFRDGHYERVSFPNQQLFDEAGLIGRAASSSYVPAADTDAGKTFIAALKALFHEYAQEGLVTFHYDTEVYLGRL